MKRRILTALAGIAAAFLAGFLLLTIQGYPASRGFFALFSYSLFSPQALFNTLYKASPLILTGLSAAAAFGAGVVNLGQPGQFLIGAVAVTVLGIHLPLPPVLMIPVLILSALAAAPILLAAVGGLYTYHANVFNIAMEGMMLIGAFLGILGSYLTGFWAAGFLLALGGTTYALRRMFQVKGALIDPSIQPMPRWNIPLIRDIPLLGEVLSDHPFMVYLSIAVVFIASYHLYMTSFGLRLRAVGEDAKAADSAGISSKGLKTSAILISGVLCALAGVFLSLGYVTLFAENMSAGRGWISLAVIILTRGRPVNVLLMVLVFGFFDGLGLSLQNTAIPPQFTGMLPYLATLGALYFYSRRKTS